MLDKNHSLDKGTCTRHSRRANNSLLFQSGEAEAKDYVAEATANGITDGTKPQMFLTRQDGLTMMGRLGLLGLKEGDEPSEWAKEIWDELTAEGIFDGTNPGTAISREQTAAVLKRYADKLTAKTE